MGWEWMGKIVRFWCIAALLAVILLVSCAFVAGKNARGVDLPQIGKPMPRGDIQQFVYWERFSRDQYKLDYPQYDRVNEMQKVTTYHLRNPHRLEWMPPPCPNCQRLPPCMISTIIHPDRFEIIKVLSYQQECSCGCCDSD